MKVIRYNRPDLWSVSPFDRMANLRDEIGRLFGTPFGELSRSPELYDGWAPPMDLHEDVNNLVAAVELPGMKKENIEVTVHDGLLSISGERTQEKRSEEGDAYRRERYFGRFSRTVALPKPVKVDAIKAVYQDGILTVTLPKTEEARPKQIEVKIA